MCVGGGGTGGAGGGVLMWWEDDIPAITLQVSKMSGDRGGDGGGGGGGRVTIPYMWNLEGGGGGGRGGGWCLSLPLHCGCDIEILQGWKKEYA